MNLYLDSSVLLVVSLIHALRPRPSMKAKLVKRVGTLKSGRYVLR